MPVTSDRNDKLLAPVSAIRVSARAIAAAAERVGGDAIELVDAAEERQKSQQYVRERGEKGRLTSSVGPTAWGYNLP